MASRNTDGSRLLKSENDRSARHTGNKVVIGRSVNDSVEVREENTNFRPSENG